MPTNRRANNPEVDTPTQRPCTGAPAPRSGPAGGKLSLEPLPGIPWVEPGADLVEVIFSAARAAGFEPSAGDVWVVCSTIVSRAEGRAVRLGDVTPSPRARELAAETGHDPRLVEWVLRESVAISRKMPGVLITRHRLGIVSANAAIDRSNVSAPALPGGAPDLPGGDEALLLLPSDPDRSARALKAGLDRRFGHPVAVVVTDSLGRPFRVGTVGAAIGIAGIPPLKDYEGTKDLSGRPLEHTIAAFADEVAAAAGLVSGQGDEGYPVVRIQGLPHREPRSSEEISARALCRSPGEDLYA